MKYNKFIFFCVLPTFFILGQIPDTLEFHLETGYVFPKCDSLGIPIFVDGIPVGVSPLKKPIPVLAGFHEIGYVPPEIQNEYVKSLLHHAIKRMYVPAGDTVSVTLFFDQEYTQFKAIRAEHKITQFIGLTMTLVALLLIWKTTG